jgi:penicillin-binding protein 1A
MGRDDARAVAGLQGGTAPARAFRDFMVVAVARRPVEQFEAAVPLPDWQLEPDEEAWGLPVEDVPLVDADGNPIGVSTVPGDTLGQPVQGAPPQGAPVDQQWLDEVLRRSEERAPPPQPRPAPPPRSVPPDPLEPRPEPTEQ